MATKPSCQAQLPNPNSCASPSGRLAAHSRHACTTCDCLAHTLVLAFHPCMAWLSRHARATGKRQAHVASLHPQPSSENPSAWPASSFHPLASGKLNLLGPSLPGARAKLLLPFRLHAHVNARLHGFPSPCKSAQNLHARDCPSAPATTPDYPPPAQTSCHVLRRTTILPAGHTCTPSSLTVPCVHQAIE